MTHSILMTVNVKNYEDVKEIQERILEEDDESWLTMFGLKKVPKGDIYPDVQTAAGMPPFISFPKEDEKGEDGLYHILVESGSHCDYSDIKESFMMWVAWFDFIQEIESYGIEFTYGIGRDGEDGILTLKQALAKIGRGSELSKYIKIGKEAEE